MTFLTSNIDLLPYNTFQVCATAHFFANFSSIENLRAIITECKERALNWYVLGGGSNILFTDSFEGVIIHPTGKDIEIDSSGLIIAQSGVIWDDFIEWTIEHGYCGIENLSYIPGTVGASPVQNIGAYGSQAADAIEWVEYFDTESMTLCTISNSDCEFGYRESIFKGSLKDRVIITRVAYRLSKDFTPQSAKLDYGDLRSKVETMQGGISPINIRTAVTEIRRSKLPEPDEVGNAGSFFKNPIVTTQKFEELQRQYPEIPSYPAPDGVKLPAGWLIDKAGFKGHREGFIGVHPKQALVLVNYGGGTAHDILSLAEKIIAKVQKDFGVEISMEVNIL